MRNLTPEEIERFVEAVIVETHNWDHDVPQLITPNIIRTALATVTLDQPKQIDLKEVEELVQAYYDLCIEHKLSRNISLIRQSIGYTLNDLKDE